MAKENKTITVEQTGSPIRRPKEQGQTLVGLGLKKRHQRVTIPDNPQNRGMIDKVSHLIKVIEQ